jgi:hypothetical protein
MSESEGNSFNENEDDHVVGLVEYINGQNAEIEQANLILEASEGDSCTYSMVRKRTSYSLMNCVYILIMLCSRVI